MSTTFFAVWAVSFCCIPYSAPARLLKNIYQSRHSGLFKGNHAADASNDLWADRKFVQLDERRSEAGKSCHYLKQELLPPISLKKLRQLGRASLGVKCERGIVANARGQLRRISTKRAATINHAAALFYSSSCDGKTLASFPSFHLMRRRARATNLSIECVANYRKVHAECEALASQC
jgi:hypothetical protein